MICRGEERIYTRLVKGWVRSNRFFQSPKSVSVTNCMTCQFFSLISLYSLQKAGNSDCTAAHSYRSLASSFFFYSWFSLSLSLFDFFFFFFFFFFTRLTWRSEFAVGTNRCLIFSHSLSQQEQEPETDLVINIYLQKSLSLIAIKFVHLLLTSFFFYLTL
jgi:hypothetical protein